METLQVFSLRMFLHYNQPITRAFFKNSQVACIHYLEQTIHSTILVFPVGLAGVRRSCLIKKNEFMWATWYKCSTSLKSWVKIYLLLNVTSLMSKVKYFFYLRYTFYIICICCKLGWFILLQNMFRMMKICDGRYGIGQMIS